MAIATGASDDYTTEPGPLYSSTNPSAPHYSAFTDFWPNED